MHRRRNNRHSPPNAMLNYFWQQIPSFQGETKPKPITQYDPNVTHPAAVCRGPIPDHIDLGLVDEFKTVSSFTDKPVKIEVDITRGRATGTLVHASSQAAMVCVGAVGSHHFQPGRIGSTAAAVAASAHCPVAIIRGRGRPTRPHANRILVEADESPDDGVVLEAAMKEARLRDAPLRVITCWQPAHVDLEAAAEGDRRIRARLDRRLARWRRRYPDLQLEAVAVPGSISGYLATHAAELQLLVVGARNHGHVREVVGPAGNAALGDSDCAVLVVDHQHL